MIDSLTLSLDLADLGLFCFPWDFDSAGAKRPLTEHGHLDATTDPEVLATWFSEFPNAKVGVNMGASGLNAADLDDKDAGRGADSVEESWLELPSTWVHDTNTGEGKHYVYLAPEGIRLNGVRNYRGMAGLDRRAGSSWLAWWGEAPNSREVFTPAPAWLNDPAEERTGASFDGGLDEWLGAAPEGEPTQKMLDAITAFPSVPFGHPQLIEAQYRVVRSAAEGAPGAVGALEKLRSLWLTPPWDTDDHRYEFDAGLFGAIRKAGAQDSRISALPDYTKTLFSGSVPEAVLTGHLIGPTKPRKNWFDSIRELVKLNLTDDEVASLVWGAPGTKAHSADFGIDYLYEQITVARAKAVEDAAPRENPSLTQSLPTASDNRISLLNDKERELVAACPNFVNRWLHTAAQRVNVLNTPYHIQNAWTILALALGDTGFLPYKNAPVGLNLYMIAPGPSGTGKSQSISIRDSLLREFFKSDPEYNFGHDISVEWMHEQLLRRDGEVSFFNADEAAEVFSKMNERGSYLAGLPDRMARYYEGYIGAVGKKSAKELQGKTAIASLSMAMYATPDRLMASMNRDIWLSGFLARVVWSISDPAVDTDEAYAESEGDRHEHVEDEDMHDVVMRGYAVELRAIRRMNGSRRPVHSSAEALARMAQNRKAMTRMMRSHENWDLLEPSVKRLGDVVRKCSALLALSSGRTEVNIVDALTAISYAEVWLANVEKVSRDVSDNQFTRDCDTIEVFIRAQGGSVSESQLAHRFRGMGTGDVRDFYARISALTVQGRIKKIEATANRGVRWEINEVMI